MYGTVAQLTVIDGKRDEMVNAFQTQMTGFDPGEQTTFLYKLDNDPNGLIIATVFESKAAYQSNAAWPETHERFVLIRSYLQEDSVWYDGEVFQHVE
jgi:hypothetical protein